MCKRRTLEWVKDAHGHALKAGLESELRVGSALVHMYAKCDNLDDARVVFEGMEDRDVVTWTMIIGGLVDHGCGHDALEVFDTMIADGMEPSEISIVAVSSACSHSEPKEIYAELRRLSETIKTEGYIPHIRLVLRKEEKELALCSYRKKLAIAWRLMRTPKDHEFRCLMNLRLPYINEIYSKGD